MFTALRCLALPCQHLSCWLALSAGCFASCNLIRSRVFMSGSAAWTTSGMLTLHRVKLSAKPCLYTRCEPTLAYRQSRFHVYHDDDIWVSLKQPCQNLYQVPGRDRTGRRLRLTSHVQLSILHTDVDSVSAPTFGPAGRWYPET